MTDKSADAGPSQPRASTSQRRPPLLRAARNVARSLVPDKAWEEIAEWMEDHRTMQSPDRRVLTEKIFTRLDQIGALRPGANVLWVGCRRYTRNYHKLLGKRGATIHTTDIDQDARQWGNPKTHKVCDITQADKAYAPDMFDVTLCSGVFGFGVNDRPMQEMTMRALETITKPGGWVIMGWNTDRVADPTAVYAVAPHLKMAPLGDFGPRCAVEGSTHVFDVLQRQGAALI
ncbi:MAG: methyltransferase domain-containing protein [Pseudomonadota bacterium]